MLRRKRKPSDFSAEVEAHLQLETERLREQGLSFEEARDGARRAFGNATRAEERFYESGRVLWWDDFWQDVRFALRMLGKSPGFAAIAVLTIALGIGATTAIFSVVDATLLHPLPYPQPDQLVSIQDDLPGVGARDVGISVPEWHDFQQSGIFDYVSPVGGGDVNLTGSFQPTRVRFLNVAPNYFAVLGVQPELGRSFNPEDRTPGFTLEALISDGLWKGALGGDSNILGKSLRLDNDLYQVIGVMPASYHDPGRTTEDRNIEVWLASGFAAAPAPPPVRNTRLLQETIARINPELTIASAQSRMDALVGALQKQFPGDYPLESAWKVRLVPLQETVVGNVRQSLFLLLGAVGLVLLIGCVNVANLLLARASARGREMAIRQALGSARPRLIRQLMTESVLLSMLGGIAGLAILFCAKKFLLQLVPESLPRLNEVSINWAVLSFALGASVIAGIFFGLAPALHAGRVDLNSVLKEEGRGLTGGGKQKRTRHLLVVTEFALSMVLMIAAGLLLRSFWDLLNVRLGFNPQNVIAVRTWLPIPNDPETDIYGTVAQEAQFLHEILRRGRTLPGVEEIAIGDVPSIPLGHSRKDILPIQMILEGQENKGGEPHVVDRATVTPDYFHLLRMTLVQGRWFNDFDNEKAPLAAVLTETLARTYWPNGDAVGKRFMRPVDSAWTTVIGVVADGRTESLAEATVPRVYLSAFQRKPRDLTIFMRGRLDTAAIPVALRHEVQTVNPELPVFGAKVLSETVSASLSVRRFSMEMIGLFALTALFLAGMGIYGVISYMVNERTHEIGIRVALGAQRTNIVRMMLRHGMELALTGAGLGLVCALIVSQLMAGLLYGVRPTDPVTFAGVAILLIGVSLLACYVPARRAMRVDPLVALRHG